MSEMRETVAPTAVSRSRTFEHAMLNLMTTLHAESLARPLERFSEVDILIDPFLA